MPGVFKIQRGLREDSFAQHATVRSGLLFQGCTIRLGAQIVNCVQVVGTLYILNMPSVFKNL